MPEKQFREKFYTMTKKREEFTFNNMCIDFCKICTFLKVVFLMFITYRMFHYGYYKNFFTLLIGLAFVNITFNYIVYNRLVPIKFKNN